MADDAGKKEEEQFEFTPEGEALGYISADQARVLAIQHARDNTGFYGPTYARVTLAWEFISQEETEDYYDIKLSFRPAGRYRGEPGVEQLIIDKTGNIQFRQILDKPSALGRPARGRPRLLIGAAVGLIVTGVVAVGALLGSGIIAGGATPTPTPAPPAATLEPTPTTVVAKEAAVVTPIPSGSASTSTTVIVQAGGSPGGPGGSHGDTGTHGHADRYSHSSSAEACRHTHGHPAGPHCQVPRSDQDYSRYPWYLGRQPVGQFIDLEPRGA